MTDKKSFLNKVFVEHAFDFFALFLAVSLGFLVDNYRDDMNSKRIAKDMSSELISEIAEDQVSTSALLIHAEKKMKVLKALCPLIESYNDNTSDSIIYLYAAHLNHRMWFESHTSTYNLLINTGYLQYFSNKTAAALTEYEIICKKTIDMHLQEKVLLDSKIYPFLQKIFHTENFSSLLDSNKLATLPLLREWTPETRWLLHNYVYELIDINKRIIQHYHRINIESKRTMSILRQEYTDN